MAMLEQASTGIPGLDKIIDGLRWGDNVVWQVDNIDDYRYFVEPFTKRAAIEKRRVVYLRFGQHPKVVPNCPEIVQYCIEAEGGFEAFSTKVHAIATTEGPFVYYVFDCLSDLLSAWATDLMIGNFFRVTCPYLHELNTIAYFAVLRGRNSNQTVARIRDTTQLLLDVYSSGNQLYVHPLKVWNRYSPTMFLPHIRTKEEFVPITSSAETARLFSKLNRQGPGDMGGRLDYWDKVFLEAEQVAARIEEGDAQAIIREPQMVDLLCRMMIGRDDRLLQLARKYFRLRDLLDIRSRLIGSGFIGGKAVGMLLARRILTNDSFFEWEKWLEPHDSFYVGSDVYYTYLVENGCWNLRLEQKKEENYFPAAIRLRTLILEGSLGETLKDQFLQMLEYFGQSPIIVRSSSLLEDSFGNAFAGKYESVFCVNQGTLNERYRLFEQAVKTVFASTMSEDALTYRWQRGLAQSDEQMALLVQRVSGAQHKHYFFPDPAGVLFSRNLYPFRRDMNPNAGMTRMVVGLGTRAVDRSEDDYPLLMALDQPLAKPYSTDDDNAAQFSQRRVDVLDTILNDIDTVSLATVAFLDSFKTFRLIGKRDEQATRRLREMGDHCAEAWYLLFDDLFLSTPLVEILGRMAKTLEKAYDNPVDIEYTVNFSGEGRMQVNLLQCRPLQVGKESRKTARDRTASPSNLFLQVNDTFMGPGPEYLIDQIVYIEPQEYAKLPVSQKYQVARIMGRLNRRARRDGRGSTMLIGPGRWGTSTPSLGIPVSFAEISNSSVIMEVADSALGFIPELSFGTHFFQDLVETGILYIALFPQKEGTVFCSEYLQRFPNSLADVLPEYSGWGKVIKLIDLRPSHGLWFDIDIERRVLACYLAAE